MKDGERRFLEQRREQLRFERTVIDAELDVIEQQLGHTALAQVIPFPVKNKPEGDNIA